MDFVTPGNIITLIISLTLIVIFRQMDRNNRSIEKAKKFGDRLKDELDAFIKERTAKLEDSTLALDLEQTKAVAAVKRLESIREELAKKEAELIDRTRAVENFGKQISSYDATVKQLLEMTAHAEANLSRVADESEFAESLGKKLEGAKKQLAEISQAIPDLQNRFAAENADRLSAIHADTMAKLDSSMSALEARIEGANRNGAALVSAAGEKMKELYQRFSAEAAKRADTLEDASFAKLKEQAIERLAKYKEIIEEKTSVLQEQTKERLLETQRLAKTFKADWQAEAGETLARYREDLSSFTAESDRSIAELQGRLDDASKRAEAESASLAAEIERVSATAEASLAALEKKNAEEIERVSASAEESLAALEKKTSAGIARLSASVGESVAGVEKKASGELNRVSASVEAAISAIGIKTADDVAALSSRLDDSVAALDAELERKMQKTADDAEARTAAVSSRLDAWHEETTYRLEKFGTIIGDAERLEAQIRISMQETEKRMTDSFAQYMNEQQLRQDDFAARLTAASDVLSDRMQTLESGLNELKSKAYENVSEKLKVFEDDFFADLARRSDAITAELENWRDRVDERLDSLSAESEKARKDTEDEYTRELKDRLSEIAEQYRAQTSRLEEQIGSVESALRARITASDQSILAFVEQSRAEFAQAQQTAALNVKSELEAHALSVQETLRKQEREVESRTRAFVDSIEGARAESEATLAAIRSDFAAWQNQNDQQIAGAKAMLADRIAALDSASSASLKSIDESWQASRKDFLARAEAEQKRLADGIDSLKKDMAAASESFERRAAEAVGAFEKDWAALSDENARKMRDASAETDQKIRSLKAMVQEVRESSEQTKDRIFQKLQADTASLGNTLGEIDRSQKAFIAQTRVFDRADELKAALESGIENLKGELSRLDSYSQAMKNLEQQYNKVRKLEEEANQKVTSFMTEKKKIDILEADFNRLIALSDTIDRKTAELTGTNDDIQQYQVQLKRFEETVAEVNSRYDRLEKKAVVLDQTVAGIDKAFESLGELEKNMQSWREEMKDIPAELEGIRSDLERLLADKEKTALSVEKLSSLDDILDDIEKRTEKMQTAREWLARTETRLDEISKQSQDQLKLLGDLMKDDGADRKSKGAPPIGIRENVVKLAHQGWKVDEIARALHLSRGEVELILELPK